MRSGKVPPDELCKFLNLVCISGIIFDCFNLHTENIYGYVVKAAISGIVFQGVEWLKY